MNNDYNNNQNGFGGGLSYQGPGMQQQPMMNQGMQQPAPDMNMAQQPAMDPNAGQSMYGGGLSYQGPGMQQPMMQQQAPVQQPAPDMNMAQQPMMEQQPMMNQGMPQQQPMQQPMYNQPMGGAPQPAPKSNNNKIIMLIPIAMGALVLLIILINIIGSKTLKCSTESEAFGIAYKMETIVKYKFGKPKKTTMKYEYDFSDVDNYKDTLDEAYEDEKDDLKDSCKSKDGCSYSIKKSGKKLIVSQTKKVDKEDLEDDDDYDYESTKEHLEGLGLECK